MGIQSFSLQPLDHAINRRWVGQYDDQPAYLFTLFKQDNFIKSANALMQVSDLVAINRTETGLELLYIDKDIEHDPTHGYLPDGRTVHHTAITLDYDGNPEDLFAQLENTPAYVAMWRQLADHRPQPSLMPLASRLPAEVKSAPSPAQPTTETPAETTAGPAPASPPSTVQPQSGEPPAAEAPQPSPPPAPEAATNTKGKKRQDLSTGQVHAYEMADGSFRGTVTGVEVVSTNTAMDNGKTREENFQTFVDNNDAEIYALPPQGRLKAASKFLKENDLDDALVSIDWEDVYEISGPYLAENGAIALTPLTRVGDGFRVKAKSPVEGNQTYQLESLDHTIDLPERAILGYFAHTGRLPILADDTEGLLSQGRWRQTDTGYELEFQLTDKGVAAAFPTMAPAELSAIKAELSGGNIRLPMLYYTPEKYAQWQQDVATDAAKRGMIAKGYGTQYKSETIAFNSHGRYFLDTLFRDNGFDINGVNTFLKDERGVKTRDYKQWLANEIILKNASLLPSKAENYGTRQTLAKYLSDPWLTGTIGDADRRQYQKAGMQAQFAARAEKMDPERKAEIAEHHTALSQQADADLKRLQDQQVVLAAFRPNLSREEKAVIRQLQDALSIQERGAELNQTLLQGKPEKSQRQALRLLSMSQNTRSRMMDRLTADLPVTALRLMEDVDTPPGIRQLLSDHKHLFVAPAPYGDNPSAYLSWHGLTVSGLVPTGAEGAIQVQTDQTSQPATFDDPAVEQSFYGLGLEGRGSLTTGPFSAQADVDISTGALLDNSSGESTTTFVAPLEVAASDLLGHEHLRLRASGTLSDLDRLTLSQDLSATAFTKRQSTEFSFAHTAMSGRGYDIGLAVGQHQETPAGTLESAGVRLGVSDRINLTGDHLTTELDVGLDRGTWSAVGAAPQDLTLMSLGTTLRYTAPMGEGRLSAQMSQSLTPDTSFERQLSVRADGHRYLSQNLKADLGLGLTDAGRFQQTGATAGLTYETQGHEHRLMGGYDRIKIAHGPGLDLRFWTLGYNWTLPSDLSVGVNRRFTTGNSDLAPSLYQLDLSLPLSTD